MEEIRTIIQRDSASSAESPHPSSSRYTRSCFDGESDSRTNSSDSTAYSRQYTYAAGNSLNSKPYSMAMHSFTPQSESEFDGTKMNFHNGVPSMQPMYVQPGDFYIPSGSNVRRQNSQVSSKSNKSNNSVDSISSVGIGSMGEEEHE